jgi:hypothetical protein
MAFDFRSSEEVQQDFRDFEFDQLKPLVLLLGNVTHEGVVSALSAAGRQYKQKYPESSICNWESILELFKNFAVREIIWKVSPLAYEAIANPEYDDVATRLLSLIAERPHILFVRKDVLSEHVDKDVFAPLSDEATENVVKSVHERFQAHGLNVLPYSKNAEVTVLTRAVASCLCSNGRS